MSTGIRGPDTAGKIQASREVKWVLGTFWAEEWAVYAALPNRRDCGVIR